MKLAGFRIKDISGAILGLAWVAFFTASVGSVEAEDISRVPPAIYTEKLAPLLTPLEKILAHKNDFNAADGEASTLLFEILETVDDQGRSVRVDHLVFRALSDSSLKDIAKDSYSFLRDDQKVHLVLAQTILPDGQRLAVQPDAIIIKDPQRDSDDSLYDSGNEMDIVYPNITVGAITESIIVTEDVRPLIPGEFTARQSWRNQWPKCEGRWIVDLPNQLADRLKITAVGTGVPSPVIEKSEPGRTRLTWTTGKVAAKPVEDGMAPSAQVGPVTWLTTLPGWEAFAHWYSEMLRGRQELKPEYRAQVDQWTKDAKSPREILDILMEHVARDVRYTGLEFGLAGFQPADCNAVWNNRYGDCKDKANLLRAMLNYKGITADLVLLNTEHQGTIEKRSPDYRQFNHMIVAAHLDGEPVFCDPTIHFAQPGMISPVDADRDVLLLTGDGFRWAHTPPVEGGRLEYHFNLKRNALGETSGWLDFHTEGYYAAAYAFDYQGSDRNSTLRKVTDLVRQFFPSADVVDVKVAPYDGHGNPFDYKAYLLMPGGDQSQADSSVTFPNAGSLLPWIGPSDHRITPLFLWPDVNRLTLEMTLPPGIEAATPPGRYHLDSPTIAANANWAAAGDKITASLEIHLKQGLISPGDFPVLRNAVRSLNSWLGQPLLLRQAKANPASSAQPGQTPEAITLDNFPLMATAAGQRSLLEKTFPLEGNVTMRRQALQQITQYFPNDKETLFYAGINLATLQDDAGQPEEAAKAIQKLLDIYRPSLSAGWIYQGEYFMAYAWMDAQKPDLATPIFLKLYSNPDVDSWHRGWAGYFAAKFLAPSSPDQAIETLRGILELDSPGLIPALPLLAHLFLEQNNPQGMQEALARLLPQKNSPQVEKAVKALLTSTDQLTATQLQQLMDLVQASGLAEDGPSADALAKAKAGLANKSIWVRLQKALQEYLVQHPVPTSVKDGTSREDIQKQIDKAESDSDAELAFALTLYQLTHFEPTEEYPEMLWQAALRAEWIEKRNGVGTAGPIQPYILDLCDQIPDDNDFFYEGQVVKERVLRRAKKYAESEAILKKLLLNPHRSPTFEFAVRKDLGLTLEAQEKYEEALAIYLPLEAKIGTSSDASDVMLRAVYLQLHLNQLDEAIRLLHSLDKVGLPMTQKANCAYQITGLTQLARDPDAAKSYWKQTQNWWKSWTALCKDLALDQPASEPVPVPAIEDLSALDQEMHQYSRQQQVKEFLQDLNVLFSAAKWDPSLANEAACARIYMDTLFPHRDPEIAALMASLVANIPPDTSNLGRRRDVILAAALIDSGQSEKALSLIAPFEANPKNDEYQFAMERLWGIIAYSRQSERRGSILALEKCLNLPDTMAERGNTVNVLDRLYQVTGRAQDEEALLRRELANPRVKTSEQFGGLTARFNELSGDKGASEDFTAFLDPWLGHFRPPWYSFAEPATLQDSRIGDNLGAVLDEPSAFSSPEAAKLYLLVAQDLTQPLERRLEALNKAGYNLLNLTLTQPRAHDLLESVIGSKLLNENFRRSWLWSAIYENAIYHRKSELQQALDNPLAKGFSPAQTADIETLKIFAACDPSSLASLTDTFAKIAQSQVTPLGLERLESLFSAALCLGELEAAQKMYDQVAKLHFSSDVTKTNFAVSLEWLKKLRLARQWIPAQKNMREIVLRVYPPEKIEKPVDYEDIRYPDNSEFLEYENGQALWLYQIKQRLIKPDNIYFWGYFIRDGLKAGDSTLSLRTDLAKALIESPTDDAEKARGIRLAGSFFDTDNPSERAGYLALIDPYRDKSKWPETAQVIRLLDTRLAMRTGQSAQIDPSSATGGTDRIRLEMQWLQIRSLLQQNDKAKLAEVLQEIKPEDLLNPEYIDESIRALDAAGLTDEAELARASARKDLYRLVLESWVFPNEAALNEVIRLAVILKTPDAIPQGWIDDLRSRIHNDFVRFHLLIGIARVQGDWPEAAKLAKKALAHYPTFYFFDWYLGEAEYRMGQKQAALKSLKIYTSYARDESDYPQAVSWISEIEQASATTPTLPN